MTKSERNSAYKSMLENYLEKPRFGLCSLIESIFGVFSNIHVEDFNELMAYKPKDTFYDWEDKRCNDSDQFWFPISDSSIRIKILKEVIEQTNEQSNE